jgi:hypothetical protein
MGRPQTRTTSLGIAVTAPILGSFGTMWNAWRQLELSDSDITFAIFSRALRSQPVTPEDADLIVAAWERRRKEPVCP